MTVANPVKEATQQVQGRVKRLRKEQKAERENLEQLHKRLAAATLEEGDVNGVQNEVEATKAKIEQIGLALKNVDEKALIKREIGEQDAYIQELKKQADLNKTEAEKLEEKAAALIAELSDIQKQVGDIDGYTAEIRAVLQDLKKAGFKVPDIDSRFSNVDKVRVSQDQQNKNYGSRTVNAGYNRKLFKGGAY